MPIGRGVSWQTRPKNSPSLLEQGRDAVSELDRCGEFDLPIGSEGDFEAERSKALLGIERCRLSCLEVHVCRGLADAVIHAHTNLSVLALGETVAGVFLAHELAGTAIGQLNGADAIHKAGLETVEDALMRMGGNKESHVLITLAEIHQAIRGDES